MLSIVLSERDESGSTVLHYITATNRMDLLDELETNRLNELKSFDYKIKDNEGLTCIHRAVFSQNVNMMERLIQLFNIKLSHDCQFSLSILNHILKNGNVEMVKWWFDNVHHLPDQFIDDNLLLFHVDGRNSEIIIDKIEYLIVNSKMET